MSTEKLLICMILISLFFHVMDDFHWQGILCDLKQKKWWYENAGEDATKLLYKNDYKVALLVHSFQWAFLTFTPSFIIIGLYTCHYFNISFLNFIDYHIINFFICLVINSILHAAIDNAKANDFSINLVEDQIFHVLQILSTVFLIWIMGGII